jgi:hypothetical protein
MAKSQQAGSFTSAIPTLGTLGGALLKGNYSLGKGFDAGTQIATGLSSLLPSPIGGVVSTAIPLLAGGASRLFGKDLEKERNLGLFNENEMAIKSNTQGILSAMGNGLYGKNIGRNIGQNAMGVTNQVQTFKYGGKLGGVRRIPKYALGGSMQDIQSDGGIGIPLSEDASMMQGNTHNQGGIDLSKQGVPFAEVENREVISSINLGNGQKQEFVFSASLVNPQTGRLFSDDVAKLELSKSKFQKQEENRKNDSKIKNTIKHIDNKIRTLAQTQEGVKQQAEQEAMIQQQGQAVMKYGGLLPKYASGGLIGDEPPEWAKRLAMPIDKSRFEGLQGFTKEGNYAWKQNPLTGAVYSPKFQGTNEQYVMNLPKGSTQTVGDGGSISKEYEEYVRKYRPDINLVPYTGNQQEAYKIQETPERLPSKGLTPLPDGSFKPNLIPTPYPSNNNTPSIQVPEQSQYEIGSYQGINPIPSLASGLSTAMLQKPYNIRLEESPLVYMPNMDAQLQRVQDTRNLSGKLLSNRATSLGSLSSNLARIGSETFNQDSQIMQALNNEAGGRASQREGLAQGVKQRNVDRVNTYNRDIASFDNAKLQSINNSVQNALNQVNVNKRDRNAYEQDMRQSMIGLMGMGMQQKEAEKLLTQVYGQTKNNNKAIDVLGKLKEYASAIEQKTSEKKSKQVLPEEGYTKNQFGLPSRYSTKANKTKADYLSQQPLQENPFAIKLAQDLGYDFFKPIQKK